MSIELRQSNENDLFGFIETVSGESFTTLEVDCYGLMDGNGIAKMQDISKISMDSFGDLKFKILFEMNLKDSK